MTETRWGCPKCGEIHGQEFTECWKCEYQRGSGGDERVVEIPPGDNPIRCQTCELKLDFIGTKKFHEGSRAAPFLLGELGEPFLFTARSGTPLWDVRFPPRSVLIFGPESDGLPEATRRKYASRLVQVPMTSRPGISLNLSIAVGIALYEVLRQRRDAVE